MRNQSIWKARMGWARGRAGLCSTVAAALALATPAIASAQGAAPSQDQDQDKARSTAVEFTSLRLLHEKGVISKEEYDRAMRDLGQVTGLRAADSLTLVLGSLSTTLYGFIEAHAMYDTTQSFTDAPVSTQVARPGTYAAEHPRFQFSLRDTRLGFRFKGPDITPSVHTSANLEMDFFAPPVAGASEAAFFDNSPLRVRHAFFKIETPVVDILFGQTWDVFGWQPLYIVPTVQYSGVPGTLFGRTPQLRLSKTIKTSAITVESVVAALRPPQRDAAVPEGQIGLRLSLNSWSALQTIFTSMTIESPASIAVTGTVRKVAVREWSAAPVEEKTGLGRGIAVSAFIPIIRATKEKRENSLALHGEFATGKGIADLYAGLVGGVENAPLPSPEPGAPAPIYTPNIDPGIAVYDSSGELKLVQWTTFIVGAQYSPPGLDGKVFVAANYARSTSSNSKELGDPTRVRAREDWFNVCAWVDPVKPLRVGLEYSRFDDAYADGEHGINHHVEIDAFWFF